MFSGLELWRHPLEREYHMSWGLEERIELEPMKSLEREIVGVFFSSRMSNEVEGQIFLVYSTVSPIFEQNCFSSSTVFSLHFTSRTMVFAREILMWFRRNWWVKTMASDKFRRRENVSKHFRWFPVLTVPFTLSKELSAANFPSHQILRGSTSLGEFIQE